MTSRFWIFLAFVAALQAQPKITCDAPVWDFGTVPQHQEFKHGFVIKNVGDQELDLRNVVPSCQCAAALPDKKMLKPGETAEIAAEFRSLTFQGRVVKTITVVSNDPKTPNLVLQIQGEVITPLALRPAQLFFGDISKSDDSSPKEFTVLAVAEVQFDPKSVVASNPLIEIAQVGETEILDNGLRSTKFTARKKKGGKVGLMNERITVKSSLPGNPVAMSVSVNVLGELQVNPRSFNLGRVKVGEGAVRSFEITKLGDKTLKIESLNCVPEIFSATVEEIEAGAKYKVTVSLSKDAKPAGFTRGTVVVRTNVEGEEEIIAYFYASVVP